MGEELPSQYDVIILGTGTPETILAAAIARIGKTVLHLDRNEYYGGDWTSFNFESLLEWIQIKQITPAETNESSTCTLPELQQFLREGELLTTLQSYVSNISNVKAVEYIKDSLPHVEDAIELDKLSPSAPTTEQNTSQTNGERHPSEDVERHKQIDESAEGSLKSEVPLDGCAQADETTDQVEPAERLSDNPECQDTSTDHSDQSDVSLDRREQAEGSSDRPEHADNPEIHLPSSSRSTQNSGTRKVWTLEELRAQKRKFNLDLAPKLLFARGPLVELLISSNISRYAEFKCTTRVLTSMDGQLLQVPCSRADVFSTKHVTVVEKRLLMKFLNFALEYENHPDEFRGFEERPFVEFLKSKKLTQHVEHYLIHSIAMVNPNTPTLQSLQSVQKFLQSLGRFGNSPFLWPLYGSAELPQCFCRLCAVFGGIYFLKRTVQALAMTNEGVCTAVISDGKRLDCSWFIMESGFAPRTFIPQGTTGKISRGIFIISGSILHSEKEQLTLLCLHPEGKIKTTVTVLELGPGACVCPSGLYVVYMSCQSIGKNAEEDLVPAAETLFSLNPAEGDTERPKLLWCVYYNQRDTSKLALAENVRGNVLLTSTPDIRQDYEYTVNEAKLLFEKMFPDEPFLPRAPDPEEILIDTEVSGNPGHSKEEQEDHPEENATELEEKDYEKIQESQDAPTP